MNKVNDEVNDELHIENLDENGINNIANMKRKLLDLDDESKKNIDKTPLPDLLPIIRLYKLLYKQINYNTSEIKSKNQSIKDKIDNYMQEQREILNLGKNINDFRSKGYLETRYYELLKVIFNIENEMKYLNTNTTSKGGGKSRSRSKSKLHKGKKIKSRSKKRSRSRSKKRY